MTTATASRQTKTRSAKVQQIGDATILWLTVGKLTTAYRVTAIPHGFGQAAFHLQKADQGDGAPEDYNVLLDGQHSLCDCKGFERFGMSAAGGTGCKHVASLTALVQSGQLPAPSKPVPAPAPDVCEFDDP